MLTKAILGGLLSSDVEAQRPAARALVLKMQQALTRVLSGAAIEAPNTPSTAAAYRVNLTAGALLIDGAGFAVSADDDVGLVGGTPDVDCIKLDGTAAVVLTLPGQSVKAAILAYRDAAGDLAYAGVFGAVATGYETAVAPTVDQCREALRLSGASWDGINGMVIGATEFGLASVQTITIGEGVAENDQFEVTVGDIASDTTAGAEDDEEDIADALVTALDTDLAELPVAVTGAGATIILTWEAGEEPEALQLDNGASVATMTVVETGAIWQTVVNAATNTELIALRAAGSLWG